MRKSFLFAIIIVVFLLTACQPINNQPSAISITVIHDNETSKLSAQEGTTIKQALSEANLILSSLDRVEPGLDEIVSKDETVKIIRVKENFKVEESPLPFESQTVKNESLTAGKTLLIQAGINGIQSNTYRILTEDGVEKSRSIVKTEITKPAQSEIIMIGIQSPYKAITIEGTLGYISSSNAWVMEASTGNRREVVNSGDLDGRIFTLSTDKKWLLFSRSASENDKDTINSLWVVNLSDSNSSPFSIDVKNVVHYAEWIPGKELTIAFSTVEPRATAPGWQATNDLQVLNFNEIGKHLDLKKLIDTNNGGIYGWWGITYAWSTDASEIAYSRPDSIGLVDSKTGNLTPLVEFDAYDTQSNWAWEPGICWSPGHSVLFSVLPAKDSGSNTVNFGLSAYIVDNNTQVNLQENTGMFSYPSISGVDSLGHYWVAYLSATQPDQSDTSRYDLRIMDRDGSNMKKLYPEEGIQGLDPQKVVWSPITSTSSSSLIAFIAQGNLMFVDPLTGNIQQVTGDGSVSKIDWK
jgi:hypothetical protein